MSLIITNMLVKFFNVVPCKWVWSLLLLLNCWIKYFLSVMRSLLSGSSFIKAFGSDPHLVLQSLLRVLLSVFSTQPLPDTETKTSPRKPYGCRAAGPDAPVLQGPEDPRSRWTGPTVRGSKHPGCAGIFALFVFCFKTWREPDLLSDSWRSSVCSSTSWRTSCQKVSWSWSCRISALTCCWASQLLALMFLFVFVC